MQHDISISSATSTHTQRPSDWSSRPGRKEQGGGGGGGEDGETQGEAHQPGISRTWVSMSTEWLMILLSRQLWQRLHIVRTAISQALLALYCRLIEPHRRRIVTGAGGEEWRCPFSGLEAFCSKWRWTKVVSDDKGYFMWIRLSFFLSLFQVIFAIGWL